MVGASHKWRLGVAGSRYLILYIHWATEQNYIAVDFPSNFLFVCMLLVVRINIVVLTHFLNQKFSWYVRISTCITVKILFFLANRRFWWRQWALLWTFSGRRRGCYSRLWNHFKEKREAVRRHFQSNHHCVNQTRETFLEFDVLSGKRNRNRQTTVRQVQY